MADKERKHLEDEQNVLVNRCQELESKIKEMAEQLDK